MSDARYIAFKAVCKYEKDSTYSNLLFNGIIDDSLSDTDKAFVFSLVKCVLERKITIDYNLSLYLSQPLKKLKPQVTAILRLGTAQILYEDKIPDSAAVNESVKLCKKCNCSFASGLVNAVLRKIAVNGEKLPDKTDIIKYLSVKYSFDEYIVKILIDAYGTETAEKITASSLKTRKLYLRQNNGYNLDYPENEAVKNIKSDDYFINNIKENCKIYDSGISVLKNDDFINGRFHIQDFSSQLASCLVAPGENDTVIDICSAPGGKSFTVAELMNGKGTVISCDIHEHKIRLIKDGADRLKLKNIKTVLNDGTVFNPDFPPADRVICDVPCSGFGVVSKKPEIKYKDKNAVEELYGIQYKILDVSSRYVKKGGRLIYSSCTLNPCENIENVEKFLYNHSDFHTVHIADGLDCLRQNEAITILPFTYDSDGFFVAVFEKEL